MKIHGIFLMRLSFGNRLRAAADAVIMANRINKFKFGLAVQIEQEEAASGPTLQSADSMDMDTPPPVLFDQPEPVMPTLPEGTEATVSGI
jgi:hypothetical protein